MPVQLVDEKFKDKFDLNKINFPISGNISPLFYQNTFLHVSLSA